MNLNSYNSMGGFSFLHSFASLFWLLLLIFLILSIIYLFKKIFEKDKEIQKVYVCPECFFEYNSLELMKKCQNFCKKYKSCNLEIIKHGKAPNTNKKTNE